MVSYFGVNYTWQQTVDNGTILGFIYGWNTTNQNYVFTEVLEPGKGYWILHGEHTFFQLEKNIIFIRF